MPVRIAMCWKNRATGANVAMRARHRASARAALLDALVLLRNRRVARRIERSGTRSQHQVAGGSAPELGARLCARIASSIVAQPVLVEEHFLAHEERR
jgi:hypothetical protein